MRTLRSFINEFPGVFRPAGMSFDAVDVSDMKLDLGYTPVKDIKITALYDRFWAEPQGYAFQKLSGHDAQEILSKGDGWIVMGGAYTFFSIKEDHKYMAYGAYPGCVRAHDLPRLIEFKNVDYWREISLRDVIMVAGFEPERILEEFGYPDSFFMSSEYSYNTLKEWYQEGIEGGHLDRRSKWYSHDNPAWFTYKLFQTDIEAQRKQHT